MTACDTAIEAVYEVRTNEPMNGQPLDIQVVYDASRGGGQRRTRSAVRSAPAVRASSRTLVTLGFLSVLIAAGMYYGTWLRLNSFINVTMMLKSPVLQPMGDWSAAPSQPEMDLNDVALKMFRITPDEPAATQPAGDESATPSAAATESGQLWTGMTAAAVITTTAYIWSALATIGFCALALAAGSMLSNTHRGVRFVGILLTLAALFALVAGVYYVWTNFRTGYRPEHLRAAMGGLAALFLAIGLTIRGRLRGTTRLAAIAVILAAIGSVAGLYLWHGSGAIEAQYAMPAFLAMVFGVHSLWGWVLLIASWRL